MVNSLRLSLMGVCKQTADPSEAFEATYPELSEVALRLKPSHPLRVGRASLVLHGKTSRHEACVDYSSYEQAIGIGSR